VRLAGCNLHCAYCDTGYARPAASGKKVTITEIVARVSAYQISLVEITGGEPLLQEETSLLVKELLKLNFTVLMETNGSLSIAGIDPRVFFIVDVKTPGSRVAAGFNLGNLALLQPHHQLKFVLLDEADFFWSLDFIAEHKSEIDQIETIFSPVTKSFAPARLAELMLEHRVNARLQLQLHTLLWPECARGR
jgi:7-carboxy-7-deazaguanine synthase